jgi:hypothetical protein
MVHQDYLLGTISYQIEGWWLPLSEMGWIVDGITWYIYNLIHGVDLYDNINILPILNPIPIA